MPDAVRKVIRIVKRKNPESEKPQGSEKDNRTEAQLRRELVSVVASWIKDRKDGSCRRVEAFETVGRLR
jgi:hypothetical protein